MDYFPHERSVHSIALSYESNSYFATACDDGKIRIFDTRQPHILGTFMYSYSISEIIIGNSLEVIADILHCLKGSSKTV